MKALTIRNVDGSLACALEQEKQRSGASLNNTVLALLRRALGLDTTEEPSNGLRELAGTWSRAEFEEFENAVAGFEQIDDELWS